MKEKNNYDKMFNQIDDFDKLLFNSLPKFNDNIPLSTQQTIKNAFKSKNKKKQNFNFSFVKKIAIFIICISIITISSVYAKEIIKFFTNIFTNSTRGIDKAVENGYIQNVDMDYVYDNNIGVKVDYLLIDSHNFDISFVCVYNEDISLSSITFNNLCIKNNEDTIISISNSDYISNSFSQSGISIKLVGEPQVIDDNKIRESILISSDKELNIQELYIEISQIVLTSNISKEYINGDWNFSITPKQSNLDIFEYKCTYDNIYINNVTTTQDVTCLVINIQLNALFDETQLYKNNSISLVDDNANIYYPTKMLSENNSPKENFSTIILYYPISYFDNISNLYLHIKLKYNETIDINLVKN